VQTPDHPDRQSAFSVQNLGGTRARADDTLQVQPSEPLLLHAEFDRLDWVGGIHRIVLRFIGINERCEHVQPVAGACSRLCAPEALDLLERGLIVPLRPDRPTSPAMLHLFHIDPVAVLVHADSLDPHDTPVVVAINR